MERTKYWYDEALSNPTKCVNPGEKERYIKNYQDYLLIQKNGLNIKEVILSIDLN